MGRLTKACSATATPSLHKPLLATPKYQNYYITLQYKKKDIYTLFGILLIFLKDINFPILDKFIDYLKIEKKYSQNSASKFIQHIKTASNYAVKKGLLTTDPIKDYVNSWENVDRGYLLDDEIKTIINREDSVQYRFESIMGTKG